MIYSVFNGPRPTTAGQVKVTTGTTIKTMLQLKPFNKMRIIEVNCDFDGSAAGTPILVELCEVDVAATVTAFVDADITKYDDTGATAASVMGLTLSTTASGYTASGEGIVAALRMFDARLIAPSNQYTKQFPLGREPSIDPAKFFRVRVTAPVAVNCICSVVVSFGN